MNPNNEWIETPNPYKNLIAQLLQRKGQQVTISTTFDDEPIKHYTGIVAIIRQDNCLLYSPKEKESITIPYCVIKEIK